MDSSGNVTVTASTPLPPLPPRAPRTGPAVLPRAPLTVPCPSRGPRSAPSAGTAAHFPFHSSTPVTHHPSDRYLHPVQLSQALQGLSEGQVGVTLPLHPPYTPTDQQSFLFPPTSLTPIGEQCYSPAFPFNTVKVITPVPDSRDSTKTVSPNFALFDNFGLLRTSTPSQEWDNFEEELSFTTDQEWARQRLTSTDNNILDHSVAVKFSDVNLNSPRSDSESANMEELDRELNRLGNLRSNLLRRLNMYTPDDVVEATLDEVNDELQSILIYMDEYINNVEAIIASNKDDMGVDLVKKYEDDIEYVIKEVRKHKRKIKDKMKKVSPPAPPPTPLSTYEKEILRLQEKTLKLQEDAKAKTEADKKEKATVLPETKSNEFYGETSVMGDLLLDEDWDLADNTVVSQGMRLITAWQAQINVIERKYREYENDALLYSFPQAKTDAVDAEYTRIRAKFDSVKEAVTKQDKDRGLFTLEPAKTEKVKWPMYYGNPAEDFMKWKDKMELAFLKNRVPKDAV